MNSRIVAKPKNKNSTTFSSVFGKKLSGWSFIPESIDKGYDVSNSHLGHNFGNVQVESQSFKNSCSLSLSNPSQCPYGGACHTCPPRIQAKLKIGTPGDKYEQEADRVAEQVMRMPEPKVHRKGCSSWNDMNEEEQIQANLIADRVTPLIQREVEKEDVEASLQTKEIPGQAPGVTWNVQKNINNLRGSGKPLPESERSFFEPRFGYDFSQVRIHTNTVADEIAREVNAKAFTRGSDIIFSTGQYMPMSKKGKRLLVHELVHVVQQKGATDRQNLLGQYVDQYEAKAEATSNHIVGGTPITVKHITNAPTIHKQEELTQVWRVGPIDALRARRDAKASLRDARSTGLPGLHNGPADAWRHCYWNCLLTSSIGEEQAGTVADTHEEFGGNPKNEKDMDLHNNAVGRKCGIAGSDCWRCCLDDLNAGRLLIIPDWSGAARLNPVPSATIRATGSRNSNTGTYTYGGSGYGGYY